MKKVFQNHSVVAKASKKARTGEKLLRSSIRKALLSTLLLSPALAQALGLGTLTTNSALNEPFDAKIQLLNASSEELQTLSVSLGGVDQFKNAGIERPFLLSSLKFEIIDDPAGSYLHITSQESIKEPFLNFLLEVNWAKGRLIREYTALLDPPVFDTSTRVVDTTETAVSEPEPVVAVPVPSVQQSDNIKIEQLPDATLVSETEIEDRNIVESGTASPAVVADADLPEATVVESVPVQVAQEPIEHQEKIQRETQPFSYEESSYTTKRGDSLWSIARRSRPDRSVSMQQMMLSLLNSNPDAFINGNINALKTGQVLRVPEKSEVRQITKQEAIALVKEHNELWDDYRQGLASSAALRPEGAVTSSGTVVEEAIEPEIVEEPELRLVTSTDDTTTEDSATGVNESSEDASEVLENDLALANEQLESGKSETAELQDKLKESEEIVELLKQQVELKNQELSALQQQLRETDQAKADPETETVYLDDEKAEEETKLKAEEETKLKAEEEAKLTAEEEAKLKAEEEAKLKAEEEAKLKAEEEAKLKAEEEAKANESIDDILSQLEKEEGVETTYLDSELIEQEPVTYGEYEAPAENLTGNNNETQYLTNENISDPEPVTSEQKATEEAAPTAGVDSENAIEVEEPVVETGILDKLKGLIPAGIIDSVPGGIKTILAAVLGLLALLLLGFFKLIGRGPKEEAEVLDLLDPSELDNAESVSDTVAEEVEDDFTEMDSEFSEEIADESFVETSEDVAEDFDLEYEEDNLDEVVSDDSFDIPTDDVEETVADDSFDIPTDEIEDELEAEGLVNLEDTLEQIKPLLEQTEEDGFDDEDPLEEVNLSLAYEQFDKAEALVKKAIEDHPDEDGYKLRLLEVHYAANDRDAYEDAAKSLYEVTDGEGHLWESAVAMWTEMSPERDLFEGTGDTLATTIETQDKEEGVFDISTGANIAAGMSVAGVAAALVEEADDVDSDDFINIADETMNLDSAEMINISGEGAEVAEDLSSDDEFLNIAETGELEDDFLNIADTTSGDAILDETIPGAEDLNETIASTTSGIDIDSGLDFDISDEITEIDSEDPNIDMLDITAAGTGGLDIVESDAEELFELTNEFKSVDENTLEATSTNLDESAKILEFSADDVKEDSESTIGLDETGSLTDVDETTVSTAGDDELESLAKSLEDTISGLDSGGLDDLTFEFDPDGTLESTLTSTLGVSSDLDLENEGDEIDTKLNLAKAYIELGDADGAKDILHEVSVDGNDEQKKDAQDLLQKI